MLAATLTRVILQVAWCVRRRLSVDSSTTNVSILSTRHVTTTRNSHVVDLHRPTATSVDGLPRSNEVLTQSMGGGMSSGNQNRENECRRNGEHDAERWDEIVKE